MCGMYNYSTNIEENVQPQPRFGSRVACALLNLAVSNLCLLSSSLVVLPAQHDVHSLQVSKVSYILTIYIY